MLNKFIVRISRLDYDHSRNNKDFTGRSLDPSVLSASYEAGRFVYPLGRFDRGRRVEGSCKRQFVQRLVLCDASSDRTFA